MEIQGKIIEVLPLQSGIGKASGKEWKKQDYVLETLDQYPRKICFNLWSDNIDKFAIQMGEELTVSIDIESREYNGRWYTDVRAWKVERGINAGQPVAPAPTVAAADPLAQAPTTSAPASTDTSVDDLPF